jgi:hypothetical protein
MLMCLAWWAVIFTGECPPRWHAFKVGTCRWLCRVILYLGFVAGRYPPFSGKE